jgi:hypothetical protein
MVAFEIKVVFVGMRTKTYFFYNYFGRFGFQFFLFLLLLVQKFLIINYTANRWFSSGCNFYQIEPDFFRYLQSFFDRKNTLLDTFAYNTYCFGPDALIDIMRVFFFLKPGSVKCATRS